jgi:hypothetical protein
MNEGVQRFLIRFAFGGEANAFRHGRLDPVGARHQCLVWLVALAAWVDGWGWPRPTQAVRLPLVFRLVDRGERRTVFAHLGNRRVCPCEALLARLVRYAQGISHQLVCLGVHLSRHPADSDALELIGEIGRDAVQLTEVCLSHREETVYLVHDELGVHVDPYALDPVIVRKLQSLYQRLVLGHVVGGRTDRLRDLVYGNQTPRSQERTDRRAAKSVTGVTPVSVEKVVPTLQGDRIHVMRAIGAGAGEVEALDAHAGELKTPDETRLTNSLTNARSDNVERV